ncbi:MAG: universal stress protein [Rhodospirillales bacterium]|nr:universal stress protein [Alphaproteobacteria bacterium]MBL6947490.1 universal stress protein [Rhodospirillales bacterium]
MKLNKIILASHATPGACAAEETAFKLCSKNGASLYHLLVVPDFWKGMMGDDWLNNAVSQIRFGNYVENQLVQEAATELERLSKRAKQKGIPYKDDVRLGKPAECLIDACNNGTFDLCIIGSTRPKGTEGYRSRMDMKALTQSLTVPLLVIPHPDR